MKPQIIIFLYTIISIQLFAQNPIIIYDNPTYDEGYSRCVLVGDEAIINFTTSFHDYNNNYHMSYANQFMINEDGLISNYTIIDSTSYPGYGVSIPQLIAKDSLIYQFGGLYSNNATDYRFLIRKSDSNLNIIHDTVYNINNDLIYISDAIIDSNTILVCGSSYNANKSYGFIFRINDSLDIIDSIFYPIFDSPYFNTSFIYFPSGELHLKISSSQILEDWVWKVSKSPLNIIDTLYTTLDQFLRNYTPNSYTTFIDDSTYISPISAFWGDYQLDTSYNIIGWIKWDKYSNPFDTIYPFQDTVISDYVGDFETSTLLGTDSIILGFNHNKSYFYLHADSTSIGVLFSTLNGDIGKVVYLGDGYNYSLENILRFNNGNILVMASRKIWDENAINHSFDFVVWLLDKSGDIIQKMVIPKTVKTKINLFPNPTSDFVNIELHGDMQIANITIYNINGKQVLHQQINSQQTQLNVGSLASGIYIIEGYTQGGEVFREKFVVE